MTKEEVANLFSFIAAFDQRTVGADDVDAWHKILGTLKLEDCMAAVVMHYRETDQQIRPANIIRRVNPILSEADRLPSALSVDAVLPPPPKNRADAAGPALVRNAMKRAHEENVARRNRVLAHPDLAARLCQPPLDFSRPTVWNGYIPPDTFNGAPNRSPRREALLAIDAEARERPAVT